MRGAGSISISADPVIHLNATASKIACSLDLARATSCASDNKVIGFAGWRMLPSGPTLRGGTPLDALVLEFSHDPDLLAASPYPASLRARIAGSYGHLSNAQAHGFLGEIDRSRLARVVAAHLSEKTNTPERVAALLEDSLGPGIAFAIAGQHEAMPWQDV